MKSFIALSSFFVLGSLAAPARNLARTPGLFGDVMDALGNLGHDLQNATLSGIADTITQSVENPGLTADRVQVVSGLASSQAALTAIATSANVAQNSQVMSFAAQGAQGLTSAASSVSRIGQALITGSKTSTIPDQKAIAVGIKSALDAVSCMDGGGNQELSGAISAANSPLKQLEAAGEGVIASQGHSFADLGLPDDFADQPADCSGASTTATQ